MNVVVEEWLHKAGNDFSIAEKLTDTEDPAAYDLVCYLCQQAIEKWMKALLICHKQTFPKTHNLKNLAERIQIVLPDFKFDEDELNSLTQGGVDYRYPGQNAVPHDSYEAFSTCKRLKKQLLPLIQQSDD